MAQNMLTSEHTIFLSQQIGSFEVKEHLIERTASNLYLAQDLDADRPVFLEILHPFINSDSNLALQFRQRMERVTQLEHPNIAAVHEVGTSATGVVYAAIEYVPGVSLAQKLAGAETFTVVEALDFVRQIAGALAMAHSAGIIHHDLRPENIMVTGDDKPVLVDLGVPVVANVPDSPSAGDQTNTLDYTPPEQLRGKKLIAQSNIYSLGVILYELLAGHRPQLSNSRLDIFDSAAPPRAVALEDSRGGLHLQTYRLVRECLRRQERARYEGMEQMLVAIDMAIAAEESAEPGRLTGAPLIWHRVRRAGAAGVVLLALLLLFWARGRSNAQVNAGQPEIFVPSQESTSVLEGVLAQPTATATVTATPSRTSLATPIHVQEEPVELSAPAGSSEFSSDADMTLTSSPAPTATATSSPAPSATPTITATPSPTPCVVSPWPTWVRYTIQRGDRLYPLALERGTLVEEIMRVNCLEDDLLTVGRVIWLPGP